MCSGGTTSISPGYRNNNPFGLGLNFLPEYRRGRAPTHSGHFFSIWTKNNHLGIIACGQRYIMNAVIHEDDEDWECPGCLRGQYLQKSDG